MAVFEISIEQLIEQHRQSREDARKAHEEDGGRMTLKTLYKDNVSLVLELDIMSRRYDDVKTKFDMDQGEIENLRNAVRAGQEEIVKMQHERDLYQDQLSRLRHALDCANRVRDQYYRALVAATREKGQPPPPTAEEMAKTFGVSERRPEPSFPRAGKPRIVSPELVVKWAAKF